MMEVIDKLIHWVDAPRILGLFLAMGTFAYLFGVTLKHRTEFWDGIKGEDNKLQFMEAALTIWLVLFTVMVVSDFALGLVASDKAWWSMDSVFLVGAGAKTIQVVNRSNSRPQANEPK